MGTLAHAQGTGVTPLDQVIPEATLTEVLPPAGGGRVGRYQVWLPNGYNAPENAARTYPLLLIDAASGNSHRYFRTVGDWAERNHWVCVMPTDAKNGPIDAIEANYQAILPDIKQRLRLTPRCGVMTGQSGGSRRSTLYGSRHTDLFGGVMNQAGVQDWNGSAPHIANRQMMVAVLLGVGDFNLHEACGVAEKADPARLQVRLFDGGHAWAPKELQEEILDWMAAGLIARYGQEAPARDLLTLLQSQIDAAENPAVKHELMTRYVAVYRGQRSLKRDKPLRKIADGYRDMLKDLSRDKASRNELAAMRDLQLIRARYIAGGIASAISWQKNQGSFNVRRDGPKVLQTTSGARAQALAALEAFRVKYAGTHAATLSETDRAAVAAFEGHWKK